MAQKTSSSRGSKTSGAKKSTGKSTSRAKSTSSSKKATATRSTRRQTDVRLIDDNMRHDIVGVVLIVLAVVLLTGALVQTTGVVTQFIHHALFVTLGVGAYLLPVGLAIMGVCFLIRFNEYRVPTRVIIGVILILLAILVICALATPGASTGDLSRFFEQEELVKRGGYVGAGIAWVLCELLGQVVSIIIMAGLIVVGLVIIGFSFSKTIEKVREVHARRVENRISRATSTSTREAYREAQVNRAPAKQAKEAIPTTDYALPAGENTGSISAAETVSTKLLNRLKSKRIGEQGVQTASGFDVAPTQRFDASAASVAPAAPLPKAASKKPGVSSSVTETPTGTYLPPAVPLPGKNSLTTSAAASRRAASVVETVSETPAVVEVETQPAEQTLTRKLGRKNATKPVDAPAKQAEKPAEAAEPSMTTKLRLAAEQELDGFTLPSMSLLQASSGQGNRREAESQAAQTAQVLEETFAAFNVFITVVGWVPGPTVTLYKLELPPGLKVQTINNLSADISRALMVDGVRIYSPVKGTAYVGIEVPNKKRETVYLADVLKDAPEGPLQVAIGKNVDGKAIVEDLAKMPHLLIGGTTGSGKSIAMHGMIMSILMRSTPNQVRFIMIDPKRVEFNHYEDIPHLYVPPVTDPKEASSALSWAVAEMELRLKKFQKARARDIASYNAMIDNGELDVENAHKLPYIVVVIDELADLMMNVGKEVEFSISRIAQLARAAGIHLIIATQRPDANIVTGLIKANITNRVALKVSSGTNSRVIIDQTGAENLIGRGDMLFQTTDSPKPVRIQGCFVSDKEIDKVVEEWKKQGTPEYNEAILATNKVGIGDQKTNNLGGGDNDPLLWEAADLVVENNFASTSTIQRKLSVGYARAGRIMDQLEEKGIVGPSNGSKPRDVLVNVEELETIKAFDVDDDY